MASRPRRGRGRADLAADEAALPDAVRRRLRASIRPQRAWVPEDPSAADDDPVDAEPHEPVRPLQLRGTLIAPGRPAALGLVLVLVAAVAVGVAVTWWQRPRATTVAPPVHVTGDVGQPSSASTRLTSASTEPSGQVTVHIVGAVRRPGVVSLPAGSRVETAVDEAGGPTERADLASVNLARLLVDGEQIVVLRKGQSAPPGVSAETPGGTGTSGAPGTPIDLNTATAEQLDTLPGVGPVLAGRIIDWRTAHGRFSSVDELTEVSGIGEKTFADLEPLVRV